MNPLDVLILDDSELVRAISRLALERAGLVVGELESVSELESTRATRPRLALVDVSMPGVTIEETVALTRGVHPASQTRLVLFSDRPLEELEEIAVNCGADSCIQKTSDPESLVAAVRVELERTSGEKKGGVVA